jgi:hypothetical protein
MQGFRFIILGQDGAVVNNGIILSRVTDDRYLCTFVRKPSTTRLVHVEEISQWNLFPNEDAVKEFIDALSEAQEVETVAVEEPADE